MDELIDADAAADNDVPDAAACEGVSRHEFPANRPTAPDPAAHANYLAFASNSLLQPVAGQLQQPSVGQHGCAEGSSTPASAPVEGASYPSEHESSPERAGNASINDGSPLPGAENLQIHSSSTAGPSKRPRKASTGRSRPTSSSDTLTAEAFKERLVKLRVDTLKLRAKLVYTNDQVDGTYMFPWDYTAQGPVLKGQGFYVFDGFDKTWFVLEDQSSPVPPERQALLQDINRRRQELEKIYKSGEHPGLFEATKMLLEREAAMTCQSEWGEDEDDSDSVIREWNDVRHQYTGSQMVEMIAKTRLITGKALLPGYYRVNLVELTLDGKFATRAVEMPFGLDVPSVLARLDSWSPPDCEHDQTILASLHKKLNVVMKYGSTEGRALAHRYLSELSKPAWFEYLPENRNERNIWTFKLFVKEGYRLLAGRGPGRPGLGGGWIELKDDEALKVMEDAVRAGKHPVVARKIRLRRMWPNVDALEKYLSNSDEPELTAEQLEILDDLLAGQSDEQREHGMRLAAALKAMGGPTYRPEFGDTTNQEDVAMEETL